MTRAEALDALTAAAAELEALTNLIYEMPAAHALRVGDVAPLLGGIDGRIQRAVEALQRRYTPAHAQPPPDLSPDPDSV